MSAATLPPRRSRRQLPNTGCAWACAVALLLAPAAQSSAAQPAPARPSPAQLTVPAAVVPSVGCPPTLTAQYQRLSAFPVDGAAGAVDGLTPLFFTGSALRLVASGLGLAHGSDAVPADLPPPDELVLVPGRPAQWTLWDGRAPAPTAVVHLVCEYEGGLMLHRPVGRGVRACRLDTQLAAGGAAAAREPALNRRRLARAVLACR